MSVETQTIPEPRCLATTLGSLPHTDVVRGTDLMFQSTPEIPAWVQFPKRAFHENMMVQFTEGLPGLIHDAVEKRVFFDTAAPDYVEQLTDFYTRYLAAIDEGDSAALDTFALSPDYAPGFWEFLAQLPLQPSAPIAIKGQVTGPFISGPFGNRGAIAFKHARSYYRIGRVSNKAI